MTRPTLWKPIRECCVCECTATANKKQPVPGEPRIVAISITIYRRGSGKGELRPAPAIEVCEKRLIKALAGSLFGPGREGSKIWHALRQSIAYRSAGIRCSTFNRGAFGNVADCNRSGGGGGGGDTNMGGDAGDGEDDDEYAQPIVNGNFAALVSIGVLNAGARIYFCGIVTTTLKQHGADINE